MLWFVSVKAGDHGGQGRLFRQFYLLSEVYQVCLYEACFCVMCCVMLNFPLSSGSQGAEVSID